MSPSESTIHLVLVIAMASAGVVVMTLLHRRVAPYGRHAARYRGRTIPARSGWLGMESPSVVVFATMYARGEHAGEMVPLLLAALWLLHYGYRTLVFPFRLRGGTPMPVGIVVGGFVFNCLNGYLNGRSLSEFAALDRSWLVDPRFGVGVALFATGMLMHLRADATLRSLRASPGASYRVPRGGLFEWVSCPNYLGEMIEWIGFAIAAWSPASLAFAWFTIANLFPRALAHHAWYRATFADYPRHRRAVIPFVW